MAFTGSTTLEVVRLADGRYAVHGVGQINPDVGAGEFATEAEAENWIFLNQERLDTPGIMIPGTGQAVR